MSSISGISSNPTYTPPVAPAKPPADPAAASAPTPPTTPAPANAASYRNSFGDTDNISNNVVMKDRDGDGDQGSPESKNEAAPSAGKTS